MLSWKIMQHNHSTTNLKLKVAVCFYGGSHRDILVARAHSTLSDRPAGMTLVEIAAPDGDIWRE